MKRRKIRFKKVRRNPIKYTKLDNSKPKIRLERQSTTDKLISLAQGELHNLSIFIESLPEHELINDNDLNVYKATYSQLYKRLTNPFSSTFSIHKLSNYTNKRNVFNEIFTTWYNHQVSRDLSYSRPLSKRDYETIYIDWICIDFQDGYFTFHYKKTLFRFTDSRSKKVFNKLKIYLKQLKNSHLEIIVNLETNSIVEVNNTSLLDTIFDRLAIEFFLDNIQINNPDYLAQSFLSIWSNDQIIRAFLPEKRTSYLKFFCEKYTTSYHIIPIREYRRNESNDTITEEDAFIFPLRSENWVYIFWESVEESRATYVFRCRPSDYSRAVQLVFDYIASPDVTNKRDRLRQGNVGYFKGEIVTYYKSLNHDSLEDWKRRLQEICY